MSIGSGPFGLPIFMLKVTLGAAALCGAAYVFSGMGNLLGDPSAPPHSQIVAEHASGSNGPEGYSNLESLVDTAWPMPPTGCVERATNDPNAPRVCAKDVVGVAGVMKQDQRLLTIDPIMAFYEFRSDHPCDMAGLTKLYAYWQNNMMKHTVHNDVWGHTRYHDADIANFVRAFVAKAYEVGDYRPPAWLTPAQKRGILNGDAHIPGLIWRQRWPQDTLELWTDRNNVNPYEDPSNAKTATLRDNMKWFH